MRYLLILLLFFRFTASAQPLTSDAQISLITCGKGNELYSLYGHTALRVKDDNLGIDRVYNYGTFDFSTPNFALKFVKGDLQYFVSVASFGEFISDYNYERRSVFEQILDLPVSVRQDIYDRLNQSLLTSDRFYTYKFIDRNCTTKVMDLLNDSMGEKLLVKVGNTEESYRDIIYPEFDGHFFEQLGTSLFFGPKVDQPSANIFLPIELWESVNKAQFQGKPLLKENKSWLVFEEEPAAFSWWNNVFVYILFLSLLVFWKNRTLIAVYFTIAGLIGVFFCFSGWYSFHEELKWDYNALLVNPLLLPFVWSMLRRKNKGVFIWGAVNLLCLVLYLGCLIGKIHFLIVLPMIVAHAVVLLTFALKARRAMAGKITI